MYALVQRSFPFVAFLNNKHICLSLAQSVTLVCLVLIVKMRFLQENAFYLSICTTSWHDEKSGNELHLIKDYHDMWNIQTKVH